MCMHMQVQNHGWLWLMISIVYYPAKFYISEDLVGLNAVDFKLLI